MKSDWLIFAASVAFVGLLWWTQPGFVAHYNAALVGSGPAKISWFERVVYAAALAHQPATARCSERSAETKKNPGATRTPGPSI